MTDGYRLTPLQPDTLSRDQQTVADDLAAGPRGGIVGPYDAWLRVPDFAARALSVGDYCRFETALARDLAELVILMAGRHWDSTFEFAAHAPFAEKAGLPTVVIDAIRTGEAPEFEDARARAVYDLLTEWYASHRVRDETYAAAVDLIGEAGVVEVVAITGFYAMVCMTLNVFAVPLPEGVDDPFGSNHMEERT